MSGGAGLGPAGLFSAGGTYDAGTAHQRATVPSSRLIDSSGHVVQTTDGTGGFEGMNDTAQRVAILVMGVERLPKRGPNFVQQYTQGIRDALSVLTAGQAPAAQIISIDVRTHGDLTTPRIVFRDLVDGGRVKTYPPT